MDHAIVAVIAFAGAHAGLAYAVAFLLAGAEAVPIIGAVVPGTAVIIGLGALVPGGTIGFWPLVAATTLGAVAGDGLSFWLGHRGRTAGLAVVRRHAALIARGRALFEAHGGKAVFIARFTPGVRAIVPLVAGFAGMGVARFYAMNILSAVLWAPAHVLLGVAVGASLSVLGAVAGRVLALVLILAVVAALVAWLALRVARGTMLAWQRLRPALERWAAARPAWFGGPVRSLLDPARPELRALVVLGLLLGGGLWLFLGVLEDVVSGDPLVRADLAVFALLQSLRVAAFDRVFVAVTELGDPVVVGSVALAALAWLASRRAWRGAAHLALAVGGAALFAEALKLTLRRARPHLLAVGLSGFSFPSGHATVNAALYVFLALLIGRAAGARLRVGVAVAAGLLVAAIAGSRLYLGAHWLSDVVAGLAFALAWAALLGIADLRRAPPLARPGALAGVVGAVLVLAGGLHIDHAWRTDLRRYAVRSQTRTLPLAAWRAGGWASLPARRGDLFGGFQEPFTLQWAGSPAALGAALAAAGWRSPPSWAPRSALEFLSPQADAAALPVLPRLAAGHAERLVMVRIEGPTRRLVLRLWGARTLLTDGTERRLWIGAVAQERVRRVSLLGIVLGAYVTEARGVTAPLAALAAALPAARAVRRPGIVGADWNGTILLGEGR